ncbi:unnamed protein product [Linum tenue]|uniref:Uncharacterized protein n=1 Tax=Linum tenue TaxID=586396 RepID=A0AAV0QJC9_9ROSI|nr:unnamed protein product [Linum tenue]
MVDLKRRPEWQPRGVGRRRLRRRDEQERIRGGAHVGSSSFSSGRKGANRGPRRLRGLLQVCLADSGVSCRDERDQRWASSGVRGCRAGDKSCADSMRLGVPDIDLRFVVG